MLTGKSGEGAEVSHKRKSRWFFARDRRSTSESNSGIQLGAKWQFCENGILDLSNISFIVSLISLIRSRVEKRRRSDYRADLISFARYVHFVILSSLLCSDRVNVIFRLPSIRLILDGKFVGETKITTIWRISRASRSKNISAEKYSAVIQRDEQIRDRQFFVFRRVKRNASLCIFISLSSNHRFASSSFSRMCRYIPKINRLSSSSLYPCLLSVSKGVVLFL